MAREKKSKKMKDKIYGSVFIVVILTLIIMIASFIFSFLGIEAYKTIVNNNTLESSLVTVKNVLSIKGFRFIIGNVIDNFKQCEPLFLLIIVLIGMGIGEKSGLFKNIFEPFKRIKLSIIIFLTVLIGMLSSIIGDYSYIFLIPLAGIMYSNINKNPLLGILVMFLGISLGYGASLLFSYNDYLLGIMTENAAIVDIDKSYKYSLFSNIYIMLVSIAIVSFIMTILINKFLVNKVSKKYVKNQDELAVSKKAMITSSIIGAILVLIVIYMVLPIKLPLAGILLDSDATRYIEKLFGDNSPFGNGFIFIVSIIIIICSWVYGKISGNIKNTQQFSLGLSNTFEGLGLVIVLMFFASQMLAILDWSNLGIVIGAKLIEFIGTLEFSGIPLIITLFIIVILMSILIPNTVTKWDLIAPTVVPLFMRANITPGFTQFVFKVADGIGASLTPISIYLLIMIAFLEKYNADEKNAISIFGTIKLILPVIVMTALLWLLIIVIWYVIGFPIGIGIYPTI